MSLAWNLKILISTLLLPPGNGLLLIALAGAWRRRRWAFALAACGGALLLAQSLPFVAGRLIATLEEQNPPLATTRPAADAIVILGSGLLTAAAEYGGDTANERTLLRTRYGATLARRYGLPVLVSGGRLPPTRRTEAEVMAGILQDEFGVAVRWQEAASMDTAENAVFSAAMLKAAGIRRVLLVTQAFHMPRARRFFEQAGLTVVPAPTAFAGRPGTSWQFADFLPQAAALHRSYYALHEWLGLAWMALSPKRCDQFSGVCPPENPDTRP